MHYKDCVSTEMNSYKSLAANDILQQYRSESIPRFRIQVSTAEQLKQSLTLEKIEYIYAPMHLLTEPNERIIVVTPVFIGGSECEITSQLQSLSQVGYTRALSHTIGHIPLIKDAGMSVHGGFRLNITNSSAVKKYEQLGLSDLTLSIELSLKRIKSIKATIPRGIVAYGRLPMMLLRRVPDTNGIIDRKAKFLPLMRYENADECCICPPQPLTTEAELLNPDTLVLSDKIKDFTVDFAIIMLSPDESPKKVLDMYLNGDDPNVVKLTSNKFTRGLYYK